MMGGRPNYAIFVVLSASYLILLRSERSKRGASHHLAFMNNCPTISHTFFALSTQWMSSPSMK